MAKRKIRRRRIRMCEKHEDGNKTKIKKKTEENEKESEVGKEENKWKKGRLR